MYNYYYILVIIKMNKELVEKLKEFKEEGFYNEEIKEFIKEIITEKNIYNKTKLLTDILNPDNKIKEHCANYDYEHITITKDNFDEIHNSLLNTSVVCMGIGTLISKAKNEYKKVFGRTYLNVRDFGDNGKCFQIKNTNKANYKYIYIYYNKFVKVDLFVWKKNSYKISNDEFDMFLEEL